MADKKDKMFDGDADFDKIPDFGDDIGSYEGFDDSQSSGNAREPITSRMLHDVGSTLNYAGSKAGEGFASGIRDKLDAAMPEVTGAYDTATQAVGEAQMGWSDMVSQTRPVLNKLKITSKQLLRNMHDVIPLGLDQKLLNFLDNHFPDEEKFKEPSLKEQREANLSNVLGEVFKLQTEKAMETQQNDMVNRTIDDRLTQNRHAESIAIEGATKNAVLFQAEFTKNIYTAYLKKDLELKYRHFYVAQDTLSTLVNTTKMLQERLTAIVKNTGLPDSQKIQINELAKKKIKEKFLSTLGDKTTNLFTTLRENWSKQIVKPFISILETVNDAVAGLNDMAEQENTMAEMGGSDEPAIFSYKRGVGAGISALASILGRKAMGGVLKLLPKSTRDRIEAIASHPLRRLRNKMMDLAKSTDETGEPTLWGLVASKLLGSFNNNYKLENYSYKNLMNPGSITNKTILTIEQVIPGYLSMQTKFLEMMAMHNDHAEQKVWDFKTKKFVTEKEHTASNLKSIFGDRKQRGSALGAYATKSVQNVKSVYSNDNHKAQSLIALYQMNAKQIETFKFGLAFSDKHIRIDKRFLNTIKEIAKCKDVNQIKDDIKTSDIWKYGFKHCGRPISVANYLEAFLTFDDDAHKGELNPEAALRLEDEIENINEEKVPRIKEAIFDADERGDNEFVNSLGTRNEDGTLDIDPAKLVEIFSDNISEGDFDKSFDKNMILASKDKNWSPDKTTLVEDAWHKLKTAIDNGTIGQTLHPIFDKVINIGKNIHKYIAVNWFGEKDKDVERRENAIKKKFEEAKNFIKKTWQDGKQLATDAKKNLQQFFNKAIANAITQLLISDNDSTFKHVYRVFFYTKEDGEKLAGMPRANIDAGSVLAEIVKSRDIRNAFKEFARSAAKNKNYQIVSDLLKDSFTWFNDIMLMFEEHDGKTEIDDLMQYDNDEKKLRKKFGEKLQSIKNWQSTRSIKGISGANQLAKEEDEAAEAEKKKNNISTDTRQKKTVTQYDLLFKSEQHLFKIEGALADIHAIYISEHKGYKGLINAREQLNQELQLVNNPNYNDKAERKALFTKAQKEKADLVTDFYDTYKTETEQEAHHSELETKIKKIDEKYEQDISSLNAGKKNHFEMLEKAMQSNKDNAKNYSKNASYMDIMSRENGTAVNAAFNSMLSEDSNEAFNEMASRNLSISTSQRLSDLKSRRTNTALARIIEGKYKDELLKKITPSFIKILLDENIIAKKPIGNREQQAEAVYEECKKNGQLDKLLRLTGMNNSNIQKEVNHQKELDRISTLTKLVGNQNASTRNENVNDQQSDIENQNTNSTKSIAQLELENRQSAANDAKRLASFKLLYSQILRKADTTKNIITDLLQNQNLSKGKQKNLETIKNNTDRTISEVQQKFITKDKPNISAYTAKDVTDSMITYLVNQLEAIPEIKREQWEQYVNNSSNRGKEKVMLADVQKAQDAINARTVDYKAELQRIEKASSNVNKKKARQTAKSNYERDMTKLNEHLSRANDTVNNHLKYLNGGLDNLTGSDRLKFDSYENDAFNSANNQFNPSIKILPDELAIQSTLNYSNNNGILPLTRREYLAAHNKSWSGVSQRIQSYIEKLNDFKDKITSTKTDLQNKIDDARKVVSKDPKTNRLNQFEILVNSVKRNILNGYERYVNDQLVRAYQQDESITGESFKYLGKLTKQFDNLNNYSVYSKENESQLQTILKGRITHNQTINNIGKGNTSVKQKAIEEIEKKKTELDKKMRKDIEELYKPYREANAKYTSEKERYEKDHENLFNDIRDKHNKLRELRKNQPEVVTQDQYDQAVAARKAQLKQIDDDIAKENQDYKKDIQEINNDPSRLPQQKLQEAAALTERHDNKIEKLKQQRKAIESQPIQNVTTQKQVDEANKQIDEKRNEIAKAIADLRAKKDADNKELDKLEKERKASNEIKAREQKIKDDTDIELKKLDDELKAINDPNNKKYNDQSIIDKELKDEKSNKHKNNGDFRTLVAAIKAAIGQRDDDEEARIANKEKEYKEELAKRREEEAKKATKHATGGNYIKDGTSLEKFGGVTDGWTSVLNGTGIAGEAGAETILPHKANERFKKLIYNAIALTFGKTAADRATRALHPNKSTMEQLDMDVDMYAKGTNRTGRRRKVTNEQRKNKRIKRRNKKAAQQAAGDDDSDGDTAEVVDNETVQPEEKSLFRQLWDGLKEFWNKSKEEVEAEENQTTTETKKDEDGRRKVTLDSSIKEILFAQLETLREIADKSFVGFGFGDWHIGEAFKDLKGWVGKKYQGFKNWLNSSHWLGDKVKGLLLSPLRITDSLIRNRVFNVYELPAGKDEEVGNPLITVDDFKNGLYTDAELKNRLKSVDDIKGPIWNKDGKQVISEKNIEAGLCDEHKKPINSFARQIGRFLRRRLGNVRDLAKGIGAGGWSFVKGLIFNEVFDIYKNPQNDKEDLGSPVITVADFEVGIYLDDQCTKRIKSVADITGAVYDNTGKLKVKEEDLPLLCDVNRKPINNFAARLGRFFRRRLSIVPSIVKSPLRFAGSLLFNNVCNVYKNPGNNKEKLAEPLIRVDDFEAGLYLDKEKTKKITSVADITGPVYDHTGTCRITEEDIKAGLVDEDRKPINSFAARLGRTFRHGIGGIFSKIANLHPIQTLKKVAMAPINFLSWVNKRNVDVYSKRDPKKLLVAAKDIEEGLLQYANGEIVKAASDIDQPVWWTDNAKNGAKAKQIAISQEDIDAGLIENDGTDIKGRLGIAGDISKHAISSVAKLGGKIITAPIKLGKFLVKELIIGENDPFIDVYVVDRRYKTGLRRALEGTKIESGAYYTLKEDGTTEPLKAAYDIGSEVYETVNNKPKCLITKKNLKDGLYDANGKRIHKGRLNGLAIRAGSALIHGTGKLIRGAWNGIKSVAGKGLDLAGNLFSKIFGSDVFDRIGGFFKNLFHPTSFFLGRRDLYELVTVQLMKIYDLLDQRMKKPKNVKGDADGDGDRDGSYEDFEQKLKERKAERKAKQDERKKKEKEEEKRKKKEENKKAKEEARRKKKEDKEKDDSEGGGFFSDVASYFLGDKLSKIFSRKGKAKAAENAAEAIAGGKKGIFKKLFGKLFSPFVKRGAGAGAAGNAAGQAATRAGTQTIAEVAGAAGNAAGQAAARTGAQTIAGAAGNAAGQAAARTGAQAAGNTVKKGLLHRLGNIGTKIVGKSAARAVLGASVAALNVVPIVGQIINIAFWSATAATIGYEILKTNPMDLRWQRIRFPAYGLDKSGTFYEFAYEDSIKDLEKETFKAVIKGKQAADDSAIEHFGQSIGFLAGSIGLTISDKAIKERERRLQYLRYWYYLRFLAPFLAYCEVISAYRPDNIPETDFPDPATINFDLQDQAIDTYKKQLDKIKTNKKVYDDRFDLTDETKYKKWVEDSEKAKEEAKKNMSVGERALAEAMETDNINDDNFDYTNTKNYFSQMWYNIKHGNLIDATGDAIMGVGSVIGETVSGVISLVFKDWIWHGLGFGSTNYQDAWHKAKIVLYGLDEKVDIDDLDDFEKVVGPIVNKKRGELKKEDLFDEIDDLLDDADYDTDDFIDAAKDILGYDDDKARSTVLNYIYSWYIKRFKLVLNSFLILGRAFEGETVDEFEVDDIPDQYKMQVLESFPKKTEEQIKKADCEKYKLTLEDFAKFIRTENKDKLLDASKKLNNKQTFMDMVANGKNDNEGWSLKAIVATGSHLFFKLFSAVDGLDVLSDYEFDWRKRYKYYNFSKDLYDPMKASRLGTDFDKALSELEDLATDILDKKKELGSNATRLRLTKLAEDMGFTAWQPGDNRRGPDAMDSILKASTDIVKPAPSKFYEKMMYAKSKYLMTWFKMTFLPVFSILLQVVRKYTETKNGSINVDAIPELKREEALEAFTKSADAEVGKSSKVRVILGEREFAQYYNELTLINQGIHSNKFRTNAENILKEQEKEKDTEETNIISQSVSDKNVATSLSKVDQNIANKTKVKLKGANLAVLKESMSHIEFIDPKLSQKENWRRLAYWAYGIAKDKVATQDIPVTGHQPLGYFYRKLEKLTFNRWYHNKDFNEKDIDSTLSSLYFVTDLCEEKDGNWSRSEKLKYLKEWYEKRFVPMFWTLTKAIEQQHAGGSGKIIDLKNLNIAYSDWEIFENMTELPEPEFQALVLATVDELKKQLGNIGYLTPSLMGYRKWNITQIKKEKGSIGNNVSDTSETKTTEKTVDTSIDKMYEQFDKTVADAKAKDKSTSYSNSMFTKDSINRKLLKKSVSINTNEIPNMNYSYVHANEFADNTEPVQKFASGGVISRPTKLGRNILAGEAGTETILPHKAGKNFNNLVTNAVSDAYDRNTASAVNMILAGSNAATDTTIDAINRKYGQTINGTGSNWQDAAYRRSLERYYITDEELDEPLSSSTDLLLFNIYKKISIVSNVFEKASTGKKFDTVNPEKNKSVFDSIKDTLSDGWETIKSGASSAWDTVTSAASGAWDSATSAVSAGFSAAKEYGGAMIDGAKSLLGFGDSNKSVQSGNISKDAEDTAMRIWKYFKSKGWSDQAIAGLLGNMYKESRLSSLRLQGDLSQDLAKSKVYTEKADKDLNFFKHGIGYGLCQWTYGARKENLWKFCHDKGVSVGDTNMQIAFVDYEINNGGMSKRFRDILMHSNDVNMATAIILKVYEKPARMNDPAELQERTRYAHEWYDKMTKKGNDSSIWSTVSDVSQYVVDKGKQVLQFGKEVAGAVGSSIKDTATDIANGNFGNIVSRTTQGAVDLGNDVVEAINSSKNAEVVCPTDAPVITSQFGKRHVKGGSSNHQGIDLRAKPIGQPIYAAEAGTVSYVNPKSYGAIWIEQQDGLQARYLHNSKILVKKGDKVKAGQMIALSGGTDKFGNVSHYPPHLHFEIRRNKQPIDPEIWLRSKGIKLSLDVGHTTSAHMPPLSDVGVETIDNKGREVTTPEIPAYANGSSSYYQTADQNIKSTETAQGATGNASSNVGIVSTAADSILQDKNAHSAVSTSTKAEPVSTEAPVITTDSVASGNIGTDTSSIGNQQLAELKIISGLLRDIRNGEKTVPDRKIDTETTLNSTSANTSETDALSQLIPILQTIADKLSDTSTTTPIINQTTTGIPTKKRQFAFPLDIAKRA